MAGNAVVQKTVKGEPYSDHPTHANSSSSQISSTKEADMTTPTPTLKKFPGAYSRKKGKWISEIRDPFTKCQIRLGIFDTPEEASSVYAAKKQEFQQLKKAARIDKKVPSVKKPRKFPGAFQRSAGRWSAEIRDPFRKCQIRLGMFDSPEEASNAYLAKKEELLKQKKALFGSSSRIDGSNYSLDNENRSRQATSLVNINLALPEDQSERCEERIDAPEFGSDSD